MYRGDQTVGQLGQKPDADCKGNSTFPHSGDGAIQKEQRHQDGHSNQRNVKANFDIAEF